MPLSSVVGAQSIVKPGVCTSSTRPASPYDGQVIYMTDVDQTVVWDGIQWVVLAPIAGNRNAVINGNMAVWQRGTTSTSTADGYLVADRWYIYKSGGNTTVSQQAASLDGFTYSLRFQRVAGATATGTRALAHMFENTTTARLVNKTITLSFWAKCGANFSGTSSLLGWSLITGTASTDVNFLTTGYTGQATTGSGSVTLTTSWQRFSASISVPSGKTQMGFYLSYAPTGTAGADDWFEVTGIQLESGSVATPFEFEDISETLAKCQRYYQRRSGEKNYGLLTAQTGSNLYGVIPLPVSMRVAPTSVDAASLRAFDLFNGAQVFYTFGLDGTASTENMAAIAATATGFTAFRTYYIIHNGASSYLGFSAEL